jgi:hypothetical protein
MPTDVHQMGDNMGETTPSSDPAIPMRALWGSEDYGKTDSVQGEGHELNAAHKSSSADKLRRVSIDGLTSYDLHPPPPSISDANAEYLASRLFSADHLDVILKDVHQYRRFRAFLERFHPQMAATLKRYLESQKALVAIRYANALADSVSASRPPQSQRPSRSPSVKSDIDTDFTSFSQRAVQELVNEALPAYITFRMITVVTECLVKDITATNTPFMRDLVQGLAEVFCLSDPNQPDNPLVFASEGMSIRPTASASLLTCQLRVLQYYTIQPRPDHWEELQVLAGAQYFQGGYQTHIYRAA